MVELWTTMQVAEFFGATSEGSISRTLHRLGVRPVAREPGRTGQNLYDADEVRAARDAMPSRWPAARGGS